MRLIDADALSAKFDNDKIKGCFITDADGVIRLVADAPTIKLNDLIPQSVIDDLKEELKRSKKAIAELDTNEEYKKAYICALSYVEGYIAAKEINYRKG